MTIRCKFVCDSVTRRLSNEYDSAAGKYVKREVYDAHFTAVTSGSEENKKFYASTPSGHFSVVSVREEFEPGKEYYLDITPA
jgi:hypothetical protein